MGLPGQTCDGEWSRLCTGVSVVRSVASKSAVLIWTTGVADPLADIAHAQASLETNRGAVKTDSIQVQPFNAQRTQGHRSEEECSLS